MFTRKMFIAAVSFSVLLSVIGTQSSSAASAGGRCSKAGLTQRTKGATFTCVKNGKTLRWARASSKKANPAAAAQETYVQPTQTSDGADTCKLLDQSSQRLQFQALVAGFPTLERNFEKSGIFKVAFIPIDFSDQIGESDPVGRYKDQMKLFVDYFDMVSEGRVKFEWSTHNSWVRMPGSINSYSLARSGDNFSIATAALSAADPVFNFSGVRAVYFVLPKAQTAIRESVQGFLHGPFGASGGFQTAEARIVNFALAGNYFDQPNKTVWSYWAHETGHMFPLPDLYDQTGQWGAVALPIPGGPFSGFDMMANQDGPSRTLSSWLRFIQGWISDSQVFCKSIDNLTKFQVMLNPIDNRTSGFKSVMVRTSDSRLVVVESRRTGNFDCSTASRNGIIVYTVDTRISHGEGIQRLVAPAGRGLVNENGCGVPPQYDAILKTGDSVSADGVNVRLVKSGAYDTIEVSK
jgi:M6 family metalloprotease-like protein